MVFCRSTDFIVVVVVLFVVVVVVAAAAAASAVVLIQKRSTVKALMIWIPYSAQYIRVNQRCDTKSAFIWEYDPLAEFTTA